MLPISSDADRIAVYSTPGQIPPAKNTRVATLTPRESVAGNWQRNAGEPRRGTWHKGHETALRPARNGTGRYLRQSADSHDCALEELIKK